MYSVSGQRNETFCAQDACAASSCTKNTALILTGAVIAASVSALRIILPAGDMEYSRKATSGFAYGAA